MKKYIFILIISSISISQENNLKENKFLLDSLVNNNYLEIINNRYFTSLGSDKDPKLIEDISKF